MKPSPTQKLAAWAVHVFTATGLLAAFMALLAAVERDWRECMLWLLLCLVIDGIDGTFARLARVGEVLPHVKGKYIDYVIDFFTYAILPAYLYYETTPDLSPTVLLLTTFLILLASALYYGFEDMTSPDGKHFIGFPVLWNMVVYLFIFVLPELGGTIKAGLVIFFAIIHFVPIYFAYPSMGGRWWPATLVAVVLFISSAVWNVFVYPEPSVVGRYVCLFSIVYLAILATIDTISANKKILDE